MNYKEIKSYEDACKVLGVQPISENAVAAFPKEDRKSMLAYHKLTIIARAINGGWKPDWKNQNQNKYCIGLIKGKVETTTNEGSNRILAFPSEEVMYQFLDSFRDLIEEAKELL